MLGESSNSVSQSVTFVPLGGLGRIGMNCFALQQGDEILVVDCGATFPEDDWGTDLLIPDFSWLLERATQIVGLWVTHGHEDHIGAIPHLFEQLGRSLSVFAPAQAALAIAARLQERSWDTECLLVVETGKIYEVGSFLVEPIAVAHSIIDATALCIDTVAGPIVHTADFNLDATQPAGHVTDGKRLEELGDAGVALLLSDSTNIDSSAAGVGEARVGAALDRHIEGAPRRAIVGMFSSNAHRLLALGKAAKNHGRRVCLLGRSLRRHHEILLSLGRPTIPSELLVSATQAAQLPPGELLIVAGGSQGEAGSALRRLARGDHPELRVEADDRVILSARVIPGNERAVWGMINDFLRRGISVRTPRDDPELHTSGHASRAELAQMLDWVRPSWFLPLHGTLHHLLRHAALARERGVAQTLIVEEGQSATLSDEEGLNVSARVPVRAVRVALGGELLDARTRRHRGEIAQAGAIFATVVLDELGRLREAPVISAPGVAGVDGRQDSLATLQNAARQAVAAAPRDPETQRARVLSALRKAARQMVGVRPSVIVHLQGPRSGRTSQADDNVIESTPSAKLG